MKTPFDPCPVPESAAPVTAGAEASAADPATGKAAAFATAWAPRPSAASPPAASRMAPPFRVSAEAPTPMPFASASPPATR